MSTDTPPTHVTLTAADQDFGDWLANVITDANPADGLLELYQTYGMDGFDREAKEGFMIVSHNRPTAQPTVYFPDDWAAVKLYTTALLQGNPPVRTEPF
jgi:hypothetical protein